MEFLEDVIATHKVQPPSGPVSALDITQAWSRLRAPNPSLQLVQQTLQLLRETGKKSLHIGESQVSLLISLSKLQSSRVETLGSIRASAALIISIWVRRSCLPAGPGSKLHRGSNTSTLLRNVAETFAELLQEEPEVSNLYVCPAILLLGAVSASPHCDNTIAQLCQTALVEELTIRKNLIVNSFWLPKALAGAGYALTSATGSMISSITGCLISLWTPPPFKDHRESPPLSSCASVLRVFEFLGFWLSSQNGRLDVLDGIVRVMLTEGENIVAAPWEVKNVKVMAAAGLIRGARKLGNFKGMKDGLESLIQDVAAELLHQRDEEAAVLQTRIEELQSFVPSDSPFVHQLRCISLAVTSCSRDLQGDSAIMFCLVLSLLGDVLGLSHIYSETALQQEQLENKLKAQVEGVMFREVGALARAVCEQYHTVGSVPQQRFESLFWSYAVHLYEKHRTFVSTGDDASLASKLQDNEHLKKVLEAVFLSVVLFFSTLMKGKAVAEDSRKLKLAVLALDAFSCVEYLRGSQLQLPEYVAAVKECVALVSQSREATMQLVSLCPSYQSLISYPGRPDFGWSSDAVQTTRVHFYLRVLVSCLNNIDDATFEFRLAPIIFLYMYHPNKQVTATCHHLFATFVFQRGDVLNVEGDASLAEQLGVYYINRAIEGYPEYTPAEGLVAGVAALGRYLPAGSVTMVHCMDQLVKKAEVLFSSEREDEAATIQTLLLQLLLVADIQILPFLLKRLATLILTLPRETKQAAVEQAFGVIAGSEDHVRKPSLVPWLQSLTYLSKM